MLKEIPDHLSACLRNELRNSELGDSIYIYENKHISISRTRLHFRNIDAEEADGITLEPLPPGQVTLQVRQMRDTMSLAGTGAILIVSGKGSRAAEHTDSGGTIASSAGTVDRGSVVPVFISSTVARFRHLATVLGLMPSSQLNCGCEACDHSGGLSLVLLRQSA